MSKVSEDIALNTGSDTNSAKVKAATVWLDGCSGCHMSFLDMDERIVELLEKIDLLYSPLVDHKEFPDMVDVTLVEGAVSSHEDLEKIRKVRAHTKILVSLGDCAITANVPSMRNPFGVEAIMKHAYIDTAVTKHVIPNEVVPELFEYSRPVHNFVKVDLFLQGCPPPADAIHFLLTELLEGRMPDLTKVSRLGK
ncbi:MAG TPA: NADP oxidoreductase [Ignavibacteria bacterium]|nr:NADP oxidoreductase [Ignavibacteria bacterium]HAX47806.1 NADP oxidoreductase [Bacteroidota bacterium]HRE09684.1 NADP oxidoreductase [Ignavibacteria bacterium]HRF65588.1 NADP oxidoreductase [Ignavibacteria bacterium]HRJ02916.1 NADP oxidoreductase [Ignavibacteria bacterium]